MNKYIDKGAENMIGQGTALLRKVAAKEHETKKEKLDWQALEGVR